MSTDFLLGKVIVVRTFLTMIMGAMLLGGCAAKPTEGSAQAVSAQEDKDAAACLEQPLKKQSYAEHQKSFASCMSAKGYHDDKLYPSATTANPRNPLISDGSKNIARESSPELAANEHYERAIADYNNCVLEHTSNLSACAKQQAIMNGLGKVSSRVSLSQSYQTTLPPRIPQTPQATPSQTPAPVPPQTTSSLPEQIPPPPGDRPIPF